MEKIYYPCLIKMCDNNKLDVCREPEDTPQGRAFIVLETDFAPDLLEFAQKMYSRGFADGRDNSKIGMFSGPGQR